MITIWKGPKGRIALCSGMVRPGFNNVIALLETEKGIERIELQEFDSKESICKKWKRHSEIKGYELRELHSICSACGQEKRR